MRVRRIVLVSGAAAAVGVVAASAGWACSANLSVNTLPLLAGPPGSEVRVSGNATNSGPVEFRWDGLNGPVLATAHPAPAGNAANGTAWPYAASVKIPAALPGTHYIVVQSSTGDGSDGGSTTSSWTRAAFNIPRSGPVLGQSGGSGIESSSSRSWDLRDSGTRGTDGGLGAGLVLLGIGGVGLVSAAGLLGIRRHKAHVEATNHRVD